jgi:hypothetical protein
MSSTAGSEPYAESGGGPAACATAAPHSKAKTARHLDDLIMRPPLYPDAILQSVRRLRKPQAQVQG